MDAPLHNQPELPSSTVVEPKRLPVGRTASSTRLAVAYLLSCFHLPGVGLDFLLQIHDRRSTILRWGACRDRQVHTPPALSPQECCEAIAGAPQEGGGVLFSHSWAGFSARGLPRRRGQRLWHFKTLRSSPSHRKQGSAISCGACPPFHQSRQGGGRDRRTDNAMHGLQCRLDFRRLRLRELLHKECHGLCPCHGWSRTVQASMLGSILVNVHRRFRNA